MNTPIPRQQWVIIFKESKLEYDCRRLSLQPQEMLQTYREQGINPVSAMESHRIQNKCREHIRKLFNPAQIIQRNEFRPDHINNKQLVVSVGGDNHFQFIARHVHAEAILGVNSDPVRSDGCITQINSAEIEQAISALEVGNYTIKQWTRVHAHINNTRNRFPILCNIFLGEHHREDMSRHSLTLRGTTHRQKGSGLLIYTGTGSTAWKGSPDQKPFQRTAPHLQYVLTEPYQGRITKADGTTGILLPTDDFCVTSLNDSHGVAILDALEVIPFPMGSTACITPAEPLNVIIPNL